MNHVNQKFTLSIIVAGVFIAFTFCFKLPIPIRSVQYQDRPHILFSQYMYSSLAPIALRIQLQN